ncbi:MAG: alkaline phosphatase family protein, partial [Sphingobacteriales bacterium]
MKAILNNILTLAAVMFMASATIAHAQTTSQKTIIIMMDGFGESYYRNSEMPNLNKIEKNGIYKIVPSLMPAVTNVNNIAIATGTAPAVNGITGNVYYNALKGKEEYIEDPSLIMAPTIFQRARKHGIKSALFSCKKKTIDLMGAYADISLCPECDEAKKTKWTSDIGNAPDVYSKEISYWIFKAAIKSIKEDPELGLIYIHT